MEYDKISQELMPVLRRHLRHVPPGGEVPRNVDFDDLGLDSINNVELLLDVENAFGVTIPDRYLLSKALKNRENLEQTLRILLENSQDRKPHVPVE